MKYALKIDKREHAFREADGSSSGYFKFVTVRTPDGRGKIFKVGTRILDNEELFEKWREKVLVPWVLEGVPVDERPKISLVGRHVLKLDPDKLLKANGRKRRCQ
jgi:hypothetical protein